MNSLWDIRIFLGLVPKESHYFLIVETYRHVFKVCNVKIKDPSVNMK
jgi:hypothetical protein